MNEKNYFTIVVPLSPDAQKIVQGNPSASRCGGGLVAGGGTHEAASGRCLLPFLSRGSPLWRAASPAFGVALGGAEAEQFLLCYSIARENTRGGDQEPHSGHSSSGQKSWSVPS